jgi:hypothetical protein
VDTIGLLLESLYHYLSPESAVFSGKRASHGVCIVMHHEHAGNLSLGNITNMSLCAFSLENASHKSK